MIYIILGNFIIASALQLFLFSHDIISGGVSGIGRILNHFLNFDLSTTVFIINCALFILGFIVLKKEFAAKTLVSSFVFPICLKVVGMLNLPILVEDAFLSSIIAGCMIGYGAALIIRNGGSSGGFDIIGIILEKYMKIPVSTTITIMDITLLGIQCFYHETTQIIYGVITIFITAKVMDWGLIQGQKLASIMIMTSQYDLLSNRILDESINAGVTLLHSTTGYKKEERPVVLTVVPYRKVPIIKNVIKETDPEAFVIVSSVEEVKGLIHP